MTRIKSSSRAEQLMHQSTIAFFDFACCEGCQLTVLQSEKIWAFLQNLRVVRWREIMTERNDPYDIAFCEGSIASRADQDRIREIREKAHTLVALGSCASIGCHNVLRNRWSEKQAIHTVYGESPPDLDLIPAQPVTQVVQADCRTFGCPVSLPELETVFTRLLTGRDYTPPNDPVCVECKLNDNLCVLEKGDLCLGPVTRCGCNAICTAYGDPCQGCRGLVEQANPEGAVTVVTRDRLHSIMAEAAGKFSPAEIREKFSVYNSKSEFRGNHNGR